MSLLPASLPPFLGCMHTTFAKIHWVPAVCQALCCEACMAPALMGGNNLEMVTVMQCGCQVQCRGGTGSLSSPLRRNTWTDFLLVMEDFLKKLTEVCWDLKDGGKSCGEKCSVKRVQHVKLRGGEVHGCIGEWKLENSRRWVWRGCQKLDHTVFEVICKRHMGAM